MKSLDPKGKPGRSPEQKMRRREREQLRIRTPEQKARQRELDKLRKQTPEYIEQRRERERTPEKREQVRKYKRLKIRERWLEYIDLAGGICQKCREAKYWVIMDTHHVYSAQKTMQGNIAVRRLDFNELNKCALLCCECHRLLEADDWDGHFLKRDGLGYELIEWWYTSNYDGPRDDAINDSRFSEGPRPSQAR